MPENMQLDTQEKLRQLQTKLQEEAKKSIKQSITEMINAAQSWTTTLDEKVEKLNENWKEVKKNLKGFIDISVLFLEKTNHSNYAANSTLFTTICQACATNINHNNETAIPLFKQLISFCIKNLVSYFEKEQTLIKKELLEREYNIFFTLVYYRIPSDVINDELIKELMKADVNPHLDGKQFNSEDTAMTLAHKTGQEGWVNLFMEHGLEKIQPPASLANSVNPVNDATKHTVTKTHNELKNVLKENRSILGALYHKPRHKFNKSSKKLDEYREKIAKKLRDTLPNLENFYYKKISHEGIVHALQEASLANKRATEIYWTEGDRDTLGDILTNAIQEIQRLGNWSKQRRHPQ